MPSPVNLGFNVSALSVVTVALSPSAPIAAGVSIIVLISSNLAATTGATLIDTQGNTYSLITSVTNGNAHILAFSAQLTNPLSMSDTITYSQTNASLLKICVISCVGYGLVDFPYTNTLSTINTVYSITGLIAAQANELNIGFLGPYQHAANAATGWSTLENQLDSSSGFYVAYNVNPAIAPLTFSGTMSANAQIAGMLFALIPNASPFTPNPMSKMMTLQQRPHSIGLAPTQEQGPRITIPLTLTSVLGGAANLGTVAHADLTMEDAEGVINNIQTMFVDASSMAFPMRLYFKGTQQTIFVPALSQGYYAIAVGQNEHIDATAWSHSGTDNANVSAIIQFLNVPVSCAIWAAAGN